MWVIEISTEAWRNADIRDRSAARIAATAAGAECGSGVTPRTASRISSGPLLRSVMLGSHVVSCIDEHRCIVCAITSMAVNIDICL